MVFEVERELALLIPFEKGPVLSIELRLLNMTQIVLLKILKQLFFGLAEASEHAPFMKRVNLDRPCSKPEGLVALFLLELQVLESRRYPVAAIRQRARLK